MKTDAAIKTDKELFKRRNEPIENVAKINILHLAPAQLHRHLDANIYLQSSMFILVLYGTAEIEINFRKYEICRGEIILLSFGHFFKIQHFSQDFRCVVLYVGKEYIDEMFSTDMIYKRVKYGVRMYKTPLLKLSAMESDLLLQRLEFVRGIVSNEQHRYHKEMILSTLLIFFLDLSHIIEKEVQEDSGNKQSRDELYFQQFLELLVLHYKIEHYVEFYADKLHITTHYLTMILKRLSGQTVSDLIFQLLFSEAKVLLQQPKLSIQQIAEEFHFSDQSAFGKFFKRKSGLSPKEFRQKMNA